MFDNSLIATNDFLMADLVVEALADSSWFASLGPDLGARLCAAARTRRLTDGDAVYRQGDPPDGLYGVLDGTVRLTSYSEQGTGHILLLARRGDWFGEVSTLDAGSRQQDAVSDGEVSLLHVPMSEVERVALAEPQLWRAIGRLGSLHQRAALDFMKAMGAMPAEGRVLALLRALGDRRPGGRLGVTHEEIAANVGLSRQTVTTVLQRLRRRGVIELGYRSVTLTSRFSGGR